MLGFKKYYCFLFYNTYDNKIKVETVLLRQNLTGFIYFLRSLFQY
jgi:hypothetical protein